MKNRKRIQQKQHKKNRVGSWLFPLLFILLLGMTACGKTTEGDSGAGTVAQDPGSEGSEGHTGSAEPEPVLSEKVVPIDRERRFYDLTALLPNPEGMYLTDYIMEDQEQVLLLYTMSETGAGESTYASVYRMSLADGTVSPVMEKKELKIQATESWYHECAFVRTDSLQFFDRSGAVLYDIKKDSEPVIFSQEKDYYCQEFTAAGNLYYLDLKNVLYRVLPGEKGKTEEVWTLPTGYTSLVLNEIGTDYVVFTAATAWNSGMGRIFFRISLPDGKLEETYTVQGEEGAELQAVGDGYAVRNILDDYKPTALQVRSEGKQYSLDYTGQNELMKKLAQGEAFLGAGQFRAKDGWLLFEAKSDGGDTDQLVLWNYGSADPEDYTEPAHTPYQMKTVSEEENRKLKDELEKEFGILIFYGEDAWLDYDTYIGIPEENPITIYGTLMNLRDCYQMYPKGFFEQLRTEESPLRINIVQSIKGNGDDQTIMEANGLLAADEKGDALILATVGYGAEKSVIFHETTHAVYNKLLEDGFLTESSPEWDALNPPGFSYSNSYNESDLPDSDYTADAWPDGPYDEVYFVGPYNKTFETEDMADLFACLMGSEEAPAYYVSPHIQAKCAFFFDLMRKGFDTKGWPAKTSWEQALEKAGK